MHSFYKWLCEAYDAAVSYAAFPVDFLFRACSYVLLTGRHVRGSFLLAFSVQQTPFTDKFTEAVDGGLSSCCSSPFGPLMSVSVTVQTGWAKQSSVLFSSKRLFHPWEFPGQMGYAIPSTCSGYNRSFQNISKEMIPHILTGLFPVS